MPEVATDNSHQCHLCGNTVKPWAIVWTFGVALCRGCLNTEGSERINTIISNEPESNNEGSPDVQEHREDITQEEEQHQLQHQVPEPSQQHHQEEQQQQQQQQRQQQYQMLLQQQLQGPQPPQQRQQVRQTHLRKQRVSEQQSQQHQQLQQQLLHQQQQQLILQRQQQHLQQYQRQTSTQRTAYPNALATAMREQYFNLFSVPQRYPTGYVPPSNSVSTVQPQMVTPELQSQYPSLHLGYPNTNKYLTPGGSGPSRSSSRNFASEELQDFIARMARMYPQYAAFSPHLSPTQARDTLQLASQLEMLSQIRQMQNLRLPVTTNKTDVGGSTSESITKKPESNATKEESDFRPRSLTSNSRELAKTAADWSSNKARTLKLAQTNSDNASSSNASKVTGQPPTPITTQPDRKRDSRQAKSPTNTAGTSTANQCFECSKACRDTFFVQCPADDRHRFCFVCARRYVVTKGKGLDVGCPSGLKCVSTVLEESSGQVESEDKEGKDSEGEKDDSEKVSMKISLVNMKTGSLKSEESLVKTASTEGTSRRDVPWSFLPVEIEVILKSANGAVNPRLFRKRQSIDNSYLSGMRHGEGKQKKLSD